MLRLRRHKSVSDPVVVVNRFVDAANRHDAEGIARCLHPDFESIQPVYPARNFTGSAQVKRNWQAIFQSEPGFRLSLIRSSASEGTVWVELHGAGSSVEVAGVFIMGVEDDLVRWARVYSAVVEQAAPEMEEAVKAPTAAAVAEPTMRDEAEELRRMIEAGREAAGLSTEADATETEATEADEARDTDEDAENPKEDRVAEEQEAGEDDEGDEDGEGDSGDEVEDEEAREDVAPVESGPTTEPEAGAHEEQVAEGTAEVAIVEAGGVDAGEAVKDDPAPADGGSTDEQPVERPEVQAAVAEVQALAEMTRPKRSRNRRRTTRIGEGDSKPESEPPAETAEKDDAARVRAAARAATSKAAAKSSARKPRDTKKN